MVEQWEKWDTLMYSYLAPPWPQFCQPITGELYHCKELDPLPITVMEVIVMMSSGSCTPYFFCCSLHQTIVLCLFVCTRLLLLQLMANWFSYAFCYFLIAQQPHQFSVSQISLVIFQFIQQIKEEIWII